MVDQMHQAKGKGYLNGRPVSPNLPIAALRQSRYARMNLGLN